MIKEQKFRISVSKGRRPENGRANTYVPPVKKKVNPAPDPGSKRSKRRKNRGFVSLERSSRKHRRALSRQFGKRINKDYHV